MDLGDNGRVLERFRSTVVFQDAALVLRGAGETRLPSGSGMSLKETVFYWTGGSVGGLAPGFKK